MISPTSVSRQPNRSSRAARGLGDAVGRERRQQLVVLAAAERELERIDAQHLADLEPARARPARRPVRSRAPDARRRAQPPEVDREPVGHVHHRGGAGAGERLPLPHPRHRPDVGLHQRTPGRPTSAPAALPTPTPAPAPARRPTRTERTRHDHAVARAGPAPRDEPPRRDLPDHRDRDHRDRPGRQVAADHRHRVLVAGRPHPALELDHPRRVGVRRQRQRHQREPRARPHRRHVGHVHHDRLRARGPAARSANRSKCTPSTRMSAVRTTCPRGCRPRRRRRRSPAERPGGRPRTPAAAWRRARPRSCAPLVPVVPLHR